MLGTVVPSKAPLSTCDLVCPRGARELGRNVLFYLQLREERAGPGEAVKGHDLWSGFG